LSLHLREKISGKGFVIATYQMPVQTGLPRVTTVSTALSTQYLQRLVEKWSANTNSGRILPCVFAGDFGFTPYDPGYTLITKGQFTKEEADKHIPGKPIKQQDWEPKLERPMKSVYSELQQVEPDFTVFHKCGGVGLNLTTVETMDYIFYDGENLKPVSIDKTPGRETVKVKSFPSASEPSDHLQLAANFVLT